MSLSIPLRREPVKILLTNDDGWYSPGLWALAEALSPLGEVVVVAPDREQSGVGPAVTLHRPLRATEITGLSDNVRTYLVEGTPADSVILGLEHLAEDGVSLVVSGINQGANLGEDVLVSGTVGAALVGYFRGLPALAISVTALKNVRYDGAGQVAYSLVKAIAERGLSQPVLLNVNVPNIRPDRIKGVEITRMGRRSYMDTVQQGQDGKRAWYWIQRTRPSWEMTPGSDIYAVRHDRVSVTPLYTDLTHREQVPGLGDLCQDVLRALALERAKGK